MMIIVSYDISMVDPKGVARLRRISKICLNYGQRVQNSVFECIVDNQTFILLKNHILKEMDNKKDSVRFYILGNKYEGKIEHYGTKKVLDLDDLLLI